MAGQLPLLGGLLGAPAQPNQPQGYVTPDEVMRRRKMAEALMQEAGNYSPVSHWTQALSRAFKGVRAGVEGANAAKDEAAGRSAATAAIERLLTGGETPAGVSPTSSPTSYAPTIGTAPAPAATGSEPRGVRTNNPGNIKDGPFARGMRGYVGTDGVNARFDSPDSGYAAMDKLLGVYDQKYGLNTVAGILGRWAPANADGNDTGGYINYVAKRLGVDPNAPLTPEARARLPEAMAYFENGREVPRGGGAAPGAPSAAGAPLMDPRQAAFARLLMDPRVGPWLTEAQRAVAAQYMRPTEYSYQTLPDGTILRMDPRGSAPTPVYQAPTKPQFTKIGQDQYGNDQYGFVNSTTGTITPVAPPSPAAQAAGGTPAVPPPPPGVDAKKWREEWTKNAANRAAPADPAEVTSLRKETQQLPSYKNYAQALPIYNSMYETAGRDTRASDVNLVYGLAKIMDPTSVVREGEMTIAQAIATLPAQLQAALTSQLAGTGRLDPDTRRQMMQEAFGRMKAYEDQLGLELEAYKGIAERRGIDYRDVQPGMRPFQLWQPPAAPPPGAGGESPAAAAAGGGGGGTGTGGTAAGSAGTAAGWAPTGVPGTAIRLKPGQ